jgi:hypothetical protein
MAHPSHQIKVGDNRYHKLDDELWRTPSIKQQRGEQQHIVAGFSWHDEIHQKKHWHEVKEEYVAAEYHWFCDEAANIMFYFKK